LSLRRHVPWLLAALLGWLPAREAGAQAVFPADNGQILAGVTQVDAQVLVLNWLEMGGSQEGFRTDAQAAFRTAVEAVGVAPDQAANFLFCELKVAGVGGGVVYSWSVGYYEFVVGGAHHLQWTSGGIVRTGRTNFSAAAAIEECGDAFRREWTRWNAPAGRPRG
jgi:hypothetical protein